MINVWGMTDIGLVRTENQDAYVVRSNEETGHLICVVCDGLGGHTGGRIASKLASEVFVDTCISNLRRDMSEQEVRSVAEFAVSAANSAVYERSREEEELRGMGTTLVSAIVWDGKAVLNNVGDSRAYLLRNIKSAQSAEESSITRVTKAHSLVERQVDMGSITEEEARSHPDRNLITRALGPGDETISDSYTVSLNNWDCLLLCTDGLIDTVTDQEMEEEIRSCAGSSECLNRLLEISKSQGAADNVTAVLLLCVQ